MVEYEVRPYVGVGPFRFGMTPDDAIRAIGPPARQTRTASKELKLRYVEFCLVFSNAAGLVEVSFEPEAHLIVGGIDLFFNPAALRRLAKSDPSPLESVGILFFPKLGITLSGFHKEGSRTATVICTGRLDDSLPKFKPYTIIRAV
jgi:hypothetical protein